MSAHPRWPLLLGLVPAILRAQVPDTGPAEPELTPATPTRYRVELILFAHEGIDPTEEYLEVVPPGSRFSPKPYVPVRRYVDDRTLRSIEQQVDGPIMRERDDGTLPPFADDLLAIDHFQPEPLNAHLRLLDPSELQLGDAFAMLDRLEAYTPLLHAGWEQDGLSEEQAVDIELGTLGSGNPTGAVRLHVSRYLHARVDIAYRPPIAPRPPLPAAPRSIDPFGIPGSFTPTPPPDPVYYLYEERRLFRGEINYLDHPAFGVLLMVTLAPEPASSPAAPIDGLAPSA